MGMGEGGGAWEGIRRRGWEGRGEEERMRDRREGGGEGIEGEGVDKRERRECARREEEGKERSENY